MENREDYATIEARNTKYIRNHLRPIVRSVYNKRMTSKVNGSLTAATCSSGLNIMENDAKNLTSLALQNSMTKTFNMSILNNSFNATQSIFGDTVKSAAH